MQTAEHILQALRKLGEKRLPLTRVYRCLFSEDLFLVAYAKLARNAGALTPGTQPDTVDGMNRERIRKIIEQLRTERFRFRPSRRIRIPKARGGSRPLGIPNFSEKLVQEALRLLLEAYYEPRFQASSHGFRPGRGCHTALTQIYQQFQGTTWFIEGDIQSCFDSVDHQRLMDILARDIQDGRVLNLIRRCLQAGYLEDWRYHSTYSGTPQGGTLSPLLMNIYLHELDTFITETLIPRYTRGKRRANHPEYNRLNGRIHDARKRGDLETVQVLDRQRRQLPSQDTHDPNYRRLNYCRYADDLLLGFIGPKTEAEEIKAALRVFLQDHLHLELSEAKTLLTHARTEHAQFLGYAISINHADDKRSPRTGTTTKTRSINGGIRLGVPYGWVDQRLKRYQQNGKPIHEAALLHYSAAEIIETYQQRFRGVAEYYQYAIDRARLGKLKYVMQSALTKTLAHKYKTSVPRIYQKYRGTRMLDGETYTTLQVEVPTQSGTRTIYWGAVSLKIIRPGRAPIDDTIPWRERVTHRRTDLLQRLQANACELCGSSEQCEVHHLRKLADLQRRWRGRREKPAWVRSMIAMRRKTLVVCAKCHTDIHAGRATPNKRQRVLESRINGNV